MAAHYFIPLLLKLAVSLFTTPTLYIYVVELNFICHEGQRGCQQEQVEDEVIHVKHIIIVNIERAILLSVSNALGVKCCVAAVPV